MLRLAGHRWARVSSVGMAGLVAVLMLVSAAAAAATTPGGRGAAATPSTSALGGLSGTAAPLPTSTGGGPHPGTLDVYEVAPGGGKTEDPAAAYDTVSFEPILNVYQTLVAYNGSSTSSFVPELAACVPGTVECIGMFGMSLVKDNVTTGVPQYFTFVLDSTARFYDPSTGASWGVYPSDVMFSLSRTMSFANLPGVGVTGGWIQTQALLPYGNSSYDGGIHAPWNNTPTSVLASMLVNDSVYCPSSAMTQDHGCVTFDADGSDSAWPFFLQLLADPLGAAIVPCGWFTYIGAGVPGFYGTTAVNGDGPCLLPGGATSTTQSAFQNYLATVDPTSWDALQLLEANNPGNPQPAVKEALVGSGPYYTEAINNAIGYVLQANPAYQAPSGCAGQAGCQPLPGDYQGTVNVFWDETDSQGIANYQAGQADLAGIQLPAHVSTLQTLLSAGKVDLTYIPTISIFFQPYNLNFSVEGVDAIPGNPNATNVPGDFLSQIAIRQFITNAYPYATVNTTLLQVDNISTGFGYGGAIPKYLGSYYADNITWPNSDPIADPNVTGSAAWWWAQGTNASSPYYDSELSACTTADPCTFPIVDGTGNTFYDNSNDYLIGEIAALSGGRLTPYAFTQTLSFGYCGYDGCCLYDCESTPPIWDLGWAPDYPDPTDYVTPIYLPDQTYALGDSVSEELGLPEFNSPTCPFAANYSDPGSAWVALVYYHDLQELPNACQGIAYGISVYWYEAAAPLAIGPQRTLDYQMANQLDYLLSLYIWNFQSEIPETYAPWINGSTLNANPMIGAGGANTWYTVQSISSWLAITFVETGLPPAAGGGVDFEGRGLMPFGPGGILTFGDLGNGTYNYTLGAVPGTYRLVSATPGSPVTVDGSSVTVTLVFTELYTVTFTESRMPYSAGGGIVFNGSGFTPFGPNVIGTGGSIEVADLTNGTYPYTVYAGAGYELVSALSGYFSGYRLTAESNATVTISGIDPSIGLQFVPVYAVTFTQAGVPDGTNWTVDVTLTSEPPFPFSASTPDPAHPLQSGDAAQPFQPAGGPTWSVTSTSPVAALLLPNGTYSYSITAAGYPTLNGTFAVTGEPHSISVIFGAGGGGSLALVLAGIAVVIAVAVIAVIRIRRPPGPTTSAHWVRTDSDAPSGPADPRPP